MKILKINLIIIKKNNITHFQRLQKENDLINENNRINNEISQQNNNIILKNNEDQKKMN